MTPGAVPVDPEPKFDEDIAEHRHAAWQEGYNFASATLGFDTLLAEISALGSQLEMLKQEVVDARCTIAQMLWQLGLREPALTWFHIDHTTMVELQANATITVYDDSEGRMIRLLGVPDDH